MVVINRKTIVLIAAFLAVAAVTVIYRFWFYSGDADPGYRIVESSSAIEDTAYYSIKVEYPVFISDDENNTVFAQLNHRIDAFLDTAASYYWGTSMDSAKQIIDETGASGQFILENDYEILDTTARLISLKLETYSFALGAHGFTAIHIYNYDVENQRFLKITDILNLDSPGNVGLLNDLLFQYFMNTDDCFNRNPAAGADFELFGLEPGNIVFYYEAYELGAYYCGMAAIRVPYQALKDAGLWNAGNDDLITTVQ